MILIIEGTDQSAKALLGNNLRNTQISSGKGALLVLAEQDGAPEHQLEKIIKGACLVPGTPANEIPWKEDPAIIMVSEKADVLYDFESLVPGFIDRFGPITTSTVGDKKKSFWDRIIG